MKKTIRTILTLVLAGSMLLPLAACGKSKKETTKDSEETVSAEESASDDESNQDTDGGTNPDTEDDEQSKIQKAAPTQTSQEENAFYHLEESAELALEPIPGVEFDTTIFSNASIAGDRILVKILVSLKDKSMEEKLLENNYQIIGDNVYTSLQLFDLSGKNITSIAMEENSEFENAFELANGEIFVVTNKTNDGECKSSPVVFVISPSGEKLRDVTFEANTNLYGSHVYPMENGNFFIAATGKLLLFDSEGKLIKKNVQDSLGPFMNYSDGKWYVTHLALPYLDIAGFQEVDINTGELLERYPSDKTITLDLSNHADCFVFTDKGIEKFLITEKTTVPVLSTENTDMLFAELKNCSIRPDGSMIVLNSVPNKAPGTEETDYFRSEANKMSVAKLTRTDKDAPEKT